MYGNERTVNNQIAVATNGTGKVCVLFQVQAKVPDIFRAINGLTLRSQNDFRYGFGIIGIVKIR